MKSICASCKYMVNKERADREFYTCEKDGQIRYAVAIQSCPDYEKIDRRRKT